ncbi:hypothetical protein Q9L58_008366 [Maublancomyces gigas]|uniref:Uncharacterized protein n=1 Tax=Discina gigas TaxID=1032678 RepID=A0ABR3G9Z1_9PEZI
MFLHLSISALIHITTAAQFPQPGLPPGPPGQNHFTDANMGMGMGISGVAPALFARQQPYVCTDPVNREFPHDPILSGGIDSEAIENSRAMRRYPGEMLQVEYILVRTISLSVAIVVIPVKSSKARKPVVQAATKHATEDNAVRPDLFVATPTTTSAMPGETAA